MGVIGRQPSPAPMTAADLLPVGDQRYAKKVGDTFTGDVVVQGTLTANVLKTTLPSDGLLLYWDFSGATSTIPDLSGNGNVGTMSGGAYRTGGKNGNGLGINGSGQQVTSSLVAPSGAKTMGFWIKTARALSVNDEWRIGFQGNTNGNGFMFMHGVGSVQDLGFWGYGSNDYVPGSSYSTAWVNDNQWHHVVATHNGAGVGYLYRDGVKYTQYYNGSVSSSMSLIATLGSTFVINNSYAGAITEVVCDSVTVHNRVLSDTEIIQLMNATA